MLYGLMFVIPILGFVTFIYHGRIFHLASSISIWGSTKTGRYLGPPRISTGIWRMRSSHSGVCTHLRHCGTNLSCTTVYLREFGLLGAGFSSRGP